MIWWIGGAVLLLAGVVLGGGYYAYRNAYAAPPRGRDALEYTPLYGAYWGRAVPLIEELKRTPFEAVTIRSADGLTLAGQYYEIREGAPVILLFHGWRSIAMRDFCGGFRLAADAGCNVLLVDQRAHGLSEGRALTFGVREREDCLAWAQYAAERFPGVPLVLCGVSMGAATVTMAASLPLPETVVGIIADSPYSSPAAIVRKVAVEDRHLPGWLAMPLAHIGAVLFAGFRLGDADGEEAMRHAAVPVLLIHGDADDFVPCEMSAGLERACASPVRREIFPGAGHVMGYMIDTPRYTQIWNDFLHEVLPQ